MMRRNHLLGSSLDELLDGTTSSTEVSSTAGTGIAALLLMELDRPGNSLVDDVLPYSSSPSSSPASTPTRAGKPNNPPKQPASSTSRKSSSYIASLKEAGRRRQSRNSSISPEKTSKDNDKVIRSFLEKKQNDKYKKGDNDLQDDSSHILSTPHRKSSPALSVPPVPTTEQSKRPPTRSVDNVIGRGATEEEGFISPIPQRQARASLTGPPISPFSPLLHQRKRRRTPPRKDQEVEQTAENGTQMLDDLSLSVCRKVSVVVRVVPSQGGENGGKNRCLFPASKDSFTVNGDVSVNASSMTTSASSRQLIVVNPSALGAQQAEVTMDTARYVANVAQISSEDWTRLYKFHQVVWSSSDTNTEDSFSNISQAIANDLLAPGSIAHRIVVATATGPTRLGPLQTAQLFGVVGQQSVARVFAPDGAMNAMDDILQRYGMAGLTVHTILERRETSGCAVSIMEVSAEGNELLYDLLASRPFSQHRQPVTICYQGGSDGGTYQVDGLSETSIESLKQFGHLIRRAFTAALHVNRHSPRGHIIVSVYPTTARDARRTSCQFIDLAVAECENRNASTTYERKFRRNTTIRKSLWALGGVLRALTLKEAGNDTPVSYRDALLTKVLQRSLLPMDSRTIVLASVAPDVDQYDETMSTLRYVNRLLPQPMGPVVQSPYTASSSLVGCTDASPSVDRSLRLDQFAGQERALLKEIVSDPRQRLAKVLKPLNLSNNPSVDSKQHRLLEKYVPTDYSDPEREEAQVEPSLSPLLDESMFLSSPGETEDLIEIHDEGEYGSSSIDEAAPTPQTRNVNRGFRSTDSKNDNQGNLGEMDDRRDVSAMDELFDSDNDPLYRPEEVSPLTAETARASRYEFPDLLGDDILNESHILDNMALQVAENRAAVCNEGDSVAHSDLDYSRNRRAEFMDELTDQNRYRSRLLEDILREGSVEEEIVFSEKSNVEEKTLESLLEEPDYEYNDNVMPGSDDVEPCRVHNKQAADNADSVKSTKRGPNLSVESILNSDVEEEGFTTYDLPLESPIDQPKKGDITSPVQNRAISMNSNNVLHDKRRFLLSDRTSNYDDLNFEEKSAEEDFHSVPTTQQSRSIVPENEKLISQGDVEASNQRSSPHHPRLLSNLYWNKAKSKSLDASQLTDVASQKVQNEIDQLQAAVDKVKQTNISVWQSSLDSINNLRYFQTAHQEALAQLLVEREASSREIQRLMIELDRRSEELEQVTSHYESDIEALRLHKSSVESERAEVFKIAEEAIATQAALEQRVLVLESELKEQKESCVPRADFIAMKQMNLSSEHEIHILKEQHAEAQNELADMEITKSTLFEALDISEKERSSALEALAFSQNETASLRKLLLDAQQFQKDADVCAIEVSRLEDELRSVKNNQSHQLKELLDDIKAKDEFILQCKQELDMVKSALVAHQEQSKAAAEMGNIELMRKQEELTQLQKQYRLYPAKLEESNRQFSLLQLERENLAEALDEAEQSLRCRVSDVRELTDSLKAVLTEKEKDQTKISRMQQALSSFQEETKSRIETIISHRNEAASLLEKTVNENKALVEVNSNLQLAVEKLQSERDEVRILLREVHADHAIQLENLINDNRLLSETNENLHHEIESFGRRRFERNDCYNDQPFSRMQKETRSSFTVNAKTYPSFRGDHYGVEELPNYSFVKMSERGHRIEPSDLQLAEEVAASVAFSAKSTVETQNSETNVLKEKLFALEDSKDDEINALKIRIKALERRLSRTEPPSRYR